MKNKKFWNVFIIIFITLLLLLVLINKWSYISARKKTEEIRPNDKFTVIIAPENPYEDTLIIEGKVLGRNGDWILYEEKESGDTFSMNIYNHIKYFDVKIYGGK